MTLSPLFDNAPTWTDDDKDVLRAHFERVAHMLVAWSQQMTNPLFGESDDVEMDARDNRDSDSAESVQISSDSRLGKVIDRFHLSALDRDVLLLSLLPEYDILYGEIYARVQPAGASLRPCVATLMGVLCPDWPTRAQLYTCFLPESRLMRSGLLALQQKEHATLSEATVLADNALYLWLLGHESLPPELALYSQWFQAPVMPDHSFDLTDKLLQCCLESEVAPVVTVLRGHNTQEQLSAIARAVGMRSKRLLSLDLTHLAEGMRIETVQKILRLAIRETRLNHACLVITSADRLVTLYPLVWEWLGQTFSELPLPLMLLIPPSGTLPRLAGVSQIEVAMPQADSAATLQLWRRQLSDVETAPDLDIAPLLLRFNPDRPSIPRLINEARIYQRLRGEESSGMPLESDDLRRAFQLHTQQSYGKLAQRYTPVRTFDDLVIDDEARVHVQELLTAVRQRETVLDHGFARKLAYGTGISALFYGDSGTGKTMVAEVLAGELGVDLIKIDLSAVVNKYIGETEKNLARIFDIAGQDAGVLFFDEADALFGKRSEVKDAKDRNANIEVAYLLQRLENYPGLVILATNHRNHLDAAFSRRLTFMIRFPFPDINLREQMWRAIWPDTIQLADNIDFHLLAQRAEMTGANIRNAALLASWLAAEEGDSSIQLHHKEGRERVDILSVNKIAGRTKKLSDVMNLISETKELKKYNKLVFVACREDKSSGVVNYGLGGSYQIKFNDSDTVLESLPSNADVTRSPANVGSATAGGTSTAAVTSDTKAAVAGATVGAVSGAAIGAAAAAEENKKIEFHGSLIYHTVTIDLTTNDVSVELLGIVPYQDPKQKLDESTKQAAARKPELPA